MKKLIITLTAAAMLTGCAAKTTATTETSQNETTEPTSAVTVKVETGTTATMNTDIWTDITSTETAPIEPTVIHESYESDLYTRDIDKVPPEEQAALDKLREKYGKDFTFIYREVQWEYLGEPIPEKRNTRYTMEDDEGRQFTAYGTEDSDEIKGDNYAFPLFKDELLEHAKDYIRSYTQAGKLWMWYATDTMMPFEAPAELTYEEFLSYFSEQEGKVFANILLPEGTELPTELSVFDNLNYLHLDDFGCQVSLYVYYLPQKDYDRLDDVVYGDVNINREHMREAHLEW